MDQAFQPILNNRELLYLDGIIASHPVKKYLTLKQAGLTVKLEKFSFKRKELNYVGFKITQ